VASRGRHPGALRNAWITWRRPTACTCARWQPAADRRVAAWPEAPPACCARAHWRLVRADHGTAGEAPLHDEGAKEDRARANRRRCRTPPGSFWRRQDDVRAFLRALRGHDLAGVRFVNPFAPAIRFTLATGLHVLVSHDRRHLWQAWNVRRALEELDPARLIRITRIHPPHVGGRSRAAAGVEADGRSHRPDGAAAAGGSIHRPPARRDVRVSSPSSCTCTPAPSPASCDGSKNWDSSSRPAARKTLVAATWR
jgi:hypothetical protein